MERLHKLAAMARANHCDGVLITEAENLCYATGFVGLEGMVLVTADGKGYCFTDSRYIEAAEKAIAPWGYQVIQPDVSYPQCVAQLCQEHKLESLLFEDQDMTVASHARYTAAVPAKLIPAGEAFSETREVKEEIEVERIVAAQRIAEKALEEILPLIKPGAVEREVAAELDYRMARLGSTGVSFQTIFVSGAKSSLPHGTPGDKKIEAGDFVTIDFGAMVGGYHSDMTRTFAVGFATDEMKKVYDTVLEAQLAGIEAFAVGKPGSQVDKAARDIIEAAGYGPYFGHGLGHSLGLNIHENPRAAKTYHREFVQGNIVTIEPGIYLPGKFGVRIEDMVYLGADGKRNLTNFPKELLIL
ncbi:MAG: aminopeptidase P family protein [Clostridia bacterium]|nr:aminopeptidase P family protein [Clostridia bacterium]